MAFWDLKRLQLEAFRPGIISKAKLVNDLIVVYMEIGAENNSRRAMAPFMSHKNLNCLV